MDNTTLHKFVSMHYNNISIKLTDGFCLEEDDLIL